MEVHAGEEGGHKVVHIFHHDTVTGMRPDPEEHYFGDEEGGKAMGHIASAANIRADAGDADPEHSKQLEEQGEEENG
jgi:hypothetical protein